MGNLIPNQALIYTRVNDTVYAQYRDPPYNKKPRWIIGQGSVGPFAGTYQGELFGYSEWKDMIELSKENPAIQDLLEKLYAIYSLTK